MNTVLVNWGCRLRKVENLWPCSSHQRQQKESTCIRISLCVHCYLSCFTFTLQNAVSLLFWVFHLVLFTHSSFIARFIPGGFSQRQLHLYGVQEDADGSSEVLEITISELIHSFWYLFFSTIVPSISPVDHHCVWVWITETKTQHLHRNVSMPKTKLTLKQLTNDNETNIQQLKSFWK